ncbi:hypothetical protein HC761_01260 [bacterium]|nr:hypothetical protein [bacterium]
MSKTKKKTVGDLARLAESRVETQAAPKAIDLRQLLFALLAGLSLACAVAFGLQTIAALKASLNTGSAEANARELAAALEQEIKLATDKLSQVAKGKRAFELVTQIDGYDQSEVRKALAAELVGARDVEVLRGADVNTALGDRFAQFGYAKLDLLLEAQRTGKRASAQVHREKDNSYSLVVAEPIQRADVVLGYLLAKFPCTATKALAAKSPAGFIELQQKGTNTNSSVLRVGSSGQASGSATIPNSRLVMSWGTQEPFQFFGIEGWIAPLLATLASLATLAGLAFVRSRPQLFADMAAKMSARSAPATPTEARSSNARQDQRLAEQTAAKLKQFTAAERRDEVAIDEEAIEALEDAEDIADAKAALAEPDFLTLEEFKRELRLP